MKNKLVAQLIIYFFSAYAHASLPCIIGEVQLTTASQLTHEYVELKGQEFDLNSFMYLYAAISSRVEYNSNLNKFRLPTVSNVTFIKDKNSNKNTKIKTGLCIKGEYPQFFDLKSPHSCRPNKLYFFLTNEVPVGFELLNQTPNFSNEFLTDNKTEILVARCRQAD